MSYAQVDGLNMYYEIHGSGRPLVLMHGNLSTIDVDFGAMIPGFAKNRQVIAIEHQAHGHTADIDRPLTVQNWADDAAALLRHLGVEGADLFGYSSGSAVALQVALDHPELVRKLVLAEVTYTLDGVHPGLLDGIKDLQPEHLAGTPFAEAYARVAPRPEDFPVLVSKIKEMDNDLPEWPAEAIRNMGKPTMLLYGDSGIAQPEHWAELFRLLGGGVMGDMAGLPDSRLAVLPASTHVTVIQRADWIVPMVEEFLEV